MVDSDYSFRFKIRMAPSKRFALVEDEWTLSDLQGRSVLLRARSRGTPLQDSEWIIVSGSGYDSEEAAQAAGNDYRDRLERAFGLLRIGADFGDRSTQTMFLGRVVRDMIEQSGHPVLHDRHGLLTFPTEPAPHFFGGGGRAYASPPREKVIAALVNAARQEPVSARGRLAYELYGASAFVSDFSPEARFLLLMMAFEAMIEVESRHSAARALITSWRTSVQDSDLPLAEKDYLTSQLGFMMKESIKQAGRRLARSLSGRTYGDLDAEQFFAKAYDLRGRLVHPTPTGPTRQDVQRLIGPLEDLVGDLIAGPGLLAALASEGRET